MFKTHIFFPSKPPVEFQTPEVAKQFMADSGFSTYRELARGAGVQMHYWATFGLQDEVYGITQLQSHELQPAEVTADSEPEDPERFDGMS